MIDCVLIFFVLLKNITLIRTLKTLRPMFGAISLKDGSEPPLTSSYDKPGTRGTENLF